MARMSKLTTQIPGRAAIARWLKFNAVGAMGLAVQLLTLALLIRIFRTPFIWATALAVETAVLHNFFWHWRWTWADRRLSGVRQLTIALMRFNLSNGMISLLGTVLCTVILTGLLKLNPILANLLSLVPCCIINYLVSDKLVFMPLEAGETT